MESFSIIFMIAYSILIYVLPIIIIVFVISQLYNIRQNTKYFIRQNQEIIDLLKAIKDHKSL